MTGRGCPHACTYCGNSFYRDLYKRQRYVRYRSVEHVISELEEGPRMMTILVKDEDGYPSLDPEDVTIGMKVRIVFDDVTDEITMPKFTPAG